MTDDPDPEGLFAFISRPVDPRWWVEGRVIRTIRSSARLVNETFWLDLSAPRHANSPSIESWIASSGDEVIIEEQRFEAQPPLGPVTLWVREIDAADATMQMAGNLAPAEDPVVPPPLEFIDAAEVKPVADSVMWEWFDRLDGKPTYAAIDHVAVQLAREDEETILGVAQGAMRLMQALDRPDLDELWIDDLGRRNAPPLLSRWRRGAILAGGQVTYEAAFRDGSDANHHPPSDGSWAVPHIADFALSKRLRRQVLVATTWSPKDGSNEESWGGLIAAAKPFKPAAEVTAQREAIQRSQREVWLDATGEDPEQHPRRWFTIRYAVIEPAGAREIVQFVSDDLDDPHAAAEAAATMTANSSGGRWVGPIELYNPHLGHPNSGPVFRIKRRFTGGSEMYRERFEI